MRVRVFGQCVAVATLICGSTITVSPQTPSAAKPDPATILSATRQALGGDTKLSAIKSFVVTGRTRKLSGDNLIPMEFEISVELPDKYVRKDEVPAQESAPSSNGFNGDGLIQIPPPDTSAPRAMAPPAGGAGAGGRPGGPPPPTPEQLQAQRAAARVARVTTLKQDFARLTLGMFASSFPSYPLTFTYFGEAEAPQGKAEVLDVKGAGNFVARFFVNSDTHLPIMVSWQTPPTSVVMLAPGQPRPATLAPGAVVVTAPAPPAADAPQAEKDKYTKDVTDLRRKTMTETKVEHRLYYQDYRESDGVQFPYRLRRAIVTDTIEETTFDRFKLNAKIEAKKFEVVK